MEICGLLETFYPNECIDSAYDIPYEILFKRGYRSIIFDIDNTLVMHGYPANDSAISLFERLRSIGFKTMILSNNKEGRVKMFCDAVSSPYLFKAGKPKKAGYLKAMELMGTDRDNTLFIGDQLFTDVWGAKRVGIYSILVKPIDPQEEIQIVLKRILERFVLFFYRRKISKMPARIVLIGFMGCGKSTVGKLLADKLGYTFMDTDSMIEERMNQSVASIFDSLGEKAFRELEKSLLDELCESNKKLIISTGGGMPLEDANRVKLRKLGKIIYLRCNSATIAERIPDISTRPLLLPYKDNVLEGIEQILSNRTEVYESLCDSVIDTDLLSPSEVVTSIRANCNDILRKELKS